MNRTEILGTISESRLFRIYKARKGTKYVILKAAASPDAMSRELLRREYELACHLHHPCIVNTVGFEEDTPAGPAIVLEYIDGTSLDRFVAAAPSSASREAVLQDILDGIGYLHHCGITHNDLKPANILVTTTGAARIIDFGLSASSDSIYSGCIGGTPGYTAPEILLGHGPAGPASDIYSAGCLIRLLFGGRTCRRIVRRCTAADPASRPRDIHTLRRLLRRRQCVPFAAAAAAVLLLSAGILAAAFLRQRSEQDEIRHRYEHDLGPAFRSTLEQIGRQEYREAAQLLTAPYYKMSLAYMDSVCRRFPMRPDGSVPDENRIFGHVFDAYRRSLDSAVNRLPSIETLSPARRDSVLRIIEQLAARPSHD